MNDTRWQSMEIAVNRKFIIEIAQAKIKRRMLSRILRDKAQHRTGEESIETSAMKITVIEHEFWARFTRARTCSAELKKRRYKRINSEWSLHETGAFAKPIKNHFVVVFQLSTRDLWELSREEAMLFGKLARNIIRKLKLKVGWGVMAAKAWN